MQRKLQYYIVMISALLVTAPAIAKETSSALYSPGCSQEQIKEMAGDALTKISKNQQWGNDSEGYIVTLDTDKMTFADLSKEMMKAGCFKPKSSQ